MLYTPLMLSEFGVTERRYRTVLDIPARVSVTEIEERYRVRCQACILDARSPGRESSAGRIAAAESVTCWEAVGYKSVIVLFTDGGLRK